MPYVKWLAKEIAGVYASYHFTDWDQAVDEVLKHHEDEGESYTAAELAEAERIARTITNKWKKDFDALG
jgi:hypothetical protein